MNILYIINYNSAFNEIIFFSEKLKGLKPEINNVYLFKNQVLSYEELLKRRNNDSTLTKIPSKKITIENNSIQTLIIFLKKILNFVRTNQILKKQLKHFIPDLIITLNDRSPDVYSSITYLFNNKKQLIPYYSYSHKSGNHYYRSKLIDADNYNALINSNLIKKAINYFLPNQVYENLFYYKPSDLLFKLFLGQLPSNPWVIGNGPSDILCIDNKFNYDRRIQDNVNINKIKIVGDFQYDDLFNSYKSKFEIKNNIIKKYNLDSEKKIIILALPQLAEHKLITKEQQLNDFNLLFNNLSSLEVQILVSLHPKMNLEDYRYLEVEFGNVKILSERLKDVIPIADLFLSSFSSTVIWASLCEIKSIIVDQNDYFKNIFRDTIFYNLDSVTILKDIEKLNETIVNHLNDNNFSFENDFIKLSRSEVFDGNTIDRYMKLFEQYASK